MDGEPVLFTVNEDQENTYLNFTYTHNRQTIEIIGSKGNSRVFFVACFADGFGVISSDCVL